MSFAAYWQRLNRWRPNCSAHKMDPANATNMSGTGAEFAVYDRIMAIVCVVVRLRPPRNPM